MYATLLTTLLSCAEMKEEPVPVFRQRETAPLEKITRKENQTTTQTASALFLSRVDTDAPYELWGKIIDDACFSTRQSPLYSNIMSVSEYAVPFSVSLGSLQLTAWAEPAHEQESHQEKGGLYLFLCQETFYAGASPHDDECRNTLIEMVDNHLKKGTFDAATHTSHIHTVFFNHGEYIFQNTPSQALELLFADSMDFLLQECDTPGIAAYQKTY